MPAALAEARKNLDNPPRIYTEIAIEQIDGNRDFFRTAVPSAFPTVTDKALLAEFKQANDAVIAALDDYKKWLQERSAEAVERRLRHRRGDVPEEARRRRDDRRCRSTSCWRSPRRICGRTRRRSPTPPASSIRSGRRCRCSRRCRPTIRRPSKLLSTTQGELDALGRFMTDHHLDHDPEGRAGHGPGNAAVPARDDERVDGHSRPVRDGGDRGVLQHDAARSEGVREGDARVHDAVVLRGDLERVGARGLAGPLSAVPLRASSFRPTSARCSARRPTAKGGRTTASRW